jgi:hypothetical protein
MRVPQWQRSAGTIGGMGYSSRGKLLPWKPNYALEGWKQSMIVQP